MPRLLEGQLASAIYAGFKGKLSRATLWRLVSAQSGTLDPLGDPAEATPETWPAEGFTDNYDDAYKARAGIPSTDLKVCLFAKSISGGAIRPEKDDKVEVPTGSGSWYQLRKADTDPATALWTCQAFKCKAPS